MSSRPCTVGLTGGLASGKSTVSRQIAARGVPVLDADRLVHRLYEPGAAGAAVVAELFGPHVLTAGGAVDRGALAARVLGAEEERCRLEAAIHPLVRAEVRRWLASRGDHAVAVVEAALLVETGSWRDYDVLVVVWCHPGQQLDRAAARGMSPERARRLLAAQATVEARRAVAAVEIDNSGPPEALQPAVETAWREVVRLCRGGRPDPASGASSV